MKAQRGFYQPVEGGLPAAMLKDQVTEEKSAKEMDKKRELIQEGKPYKGVKYYQTNSADRAKKLELRTCH